VPAVSEEAMKITSALSVTGLLALLLAFGNSLGCETSTDEVDTSSAVSPWTKQFTFGNFTINSGDVLSNQDGVSQSYCEDYVYESALPKVDLEYFTINVYLPTSPGTTIAIDSVITRLARIDGSRTDNITKENKYLARVTLDGDDYAVFRLAGVTVAPPAVTPATFANITFAFTGTYQRDGQVVSTFTKTASIYKR